MLNMEHQKALSENIKPERGKMRFVFRGGEREREQSVTYSA